MLWSRAGSGSSAVTPEFMVGIAFYKNPSGSDHSDSYGCHLRSLLQLCGVTGLISVKNINDVVIPVLSVSEARHNSGVCPSGVLSLDHGVGEWGGARGTSKHC